MSERYLISADELWQSLNDTGRPVVLDVRWALGDPHGRKHFAARRIPDSVYVDLDTELAAEPSSAVGRHPLPDIDDLQASARRWGVRRDGDVVVLDDNGGLSAARAWWLLRWAGLRDVRVLDGGLRAWEIAGYDVEDESTPLYQPAPGNVVLTAGHLPTLGPDSAAQIARSGILLDARAGERYRGEVEPIDPRAGHIPGAVSAPTSENLSAAGVFQSPAELRARFARLGAGDADDVGVYCGSGVTAAHQVLALAIAGIDASLYPGSWSQWSSDAGRPVAVGPERG
ncbi:MAG TPA: sulfurtransferase [Actinocrinis sp.]|nr:sulfurtransferase [Actinocrinis sp.]